MDAFYNDPLGLMSRGLSAANQAIKTIVGAAAEKIKNNEQLKENLKYAKERTITGMSATGQYAGEVAGKAKSNANTLYAKNYHG